jgi:hypothetical protein
VLTWLAETPAEAIFATGLIVTLWAGLVWMLWAMVSLVGLNWRRREK